MGWTWGAESDVIIRFRRSNVGFLTPRYSYLNFNTPKPKNTAAMSMGPRIYYHHDDANGRFIILYDNAWADDVYRYQTFEIVFLNQYDWPTQTGDNDIIIQYYDVNNPYSATVGICSPDRADGIEYLFDNSYTDGAAPLVDGRAIKFTTGSLYTTDVKDGGMVPEGFSLSQNYPNPFNAVSAIEFSMPEAENVKIEVFNLLGQKVETLVDSWLDAGTHTVYWNAGKQSSGVYFYKLTAGEFEDIKRMTLLK